ncbi:MAG TPA: hypothetical protein VGH19_09690 [Verrucomicrobiae bacterium]
MKKFMGGQTVFYALAVAAGISAVGCGKEEPEIAAPKPAETGAGASVGATVTASDPVAPPPVSAPPTATGTPTTPEAPEMTVPSKDALEVVTMATQSFFIANDRAPKSLDELVSSGYLKRLPVPPVGKKYVYDAENAKLSLADQ